MRQLVLILALASLAACDRNREEGTTVAITDGSGNSVGGIDGKTGELKIDVPGFQGSLKLPRIKLDADNLDLNGVKLYPGSTVDGVNVTGGEGDGGVRVSFTSPATAATVRDWLGERLGKAGFSLTTADNGLSGTTQEGKPFRLEMRPDGAASSKGTIVIG